MSVPTNVRRFEALLYASLMLDALSVAVQDRTPNAEMTEQMIMTATLLAGGMILLLVYFVWLAAHWRKKLAALGAGRSPGAVGDLARPDHRREGHGARQRHRDRLLRADHDGPVFLLQRRRAGLVQRVRFCAVP
uniref:Uncharacterized protein n=1 Tax=Bradyrhizobium japonicum TaxID=375 RepID=Q9RH68_BRAJP|nr:hypothetical protein [Bradyrhizobium japonicum]